MSRRAGFTLIELVVTMAITVIVLLIAIPRYDGFIRKQEFASSAQTAVDCFQGAQRLAAAPKSDAASRGVRYVSATLKQSGEAITCVTTNYGSFDPTTRLETNLANASNGSFISQDDTTYKIKSGSINLDSVSYPTAAAVSADSIIVFFGVLERGAPLMVQRNSGGAYYYPSPYTDSLGQGFQVTMSLSDPSNSATMGDLVISPLGNPISFRLK